MYEIESNVPLPSEAGGKYPFDKLEVGQSFLVPLVPITLGGDLDRDELIATRRSIGVSMGRASKRTGHTFEQHAVDDGVRVWRTA